jgi:hypothetical protein
MGEDSRFTEVDLYNSIAIAILLYRRTTIVLNRKVTERHKAYIMPLWKKLERK